MSEASETIARQVRNAVRETVSARRIQGAAAGEWTEKGIDQILFRGSHDIMRPLASYPSSVVHALMPSVVRFMLQAFLEIDATEEPASGPAPHVNPADITTPRADPGAIWKDRFRREKYFTNSSRLVRQVTEVARAEFGRSLPSSWRPMRFAYDLCQSAHHSKAPQARDALNVISESLVEGHEAVCRRSQDRVPDVIALRALRLAPIPLPGHSDDLHMDLRRRYPDAEPDR
jgi:hypothetical protein